MAAHLRPRVMECSCRTRAWVTLLACMAAAPHSMVAEVDSMAVAADSMAVAVADSTAVAAEEASTVVAAEEASTVVAEAEDIIKQPSAVTQ